MDMQRIDDIARRHHGVITREQSGLSPSSWGRAVRSGRFDPIHPGVARLPGTERTRLQAIHAAVLAVGQGALASHRSAALLWGMPRHDSDVVDVIVTARGRRPPLDDVRVHRPTDLAQLVPARRNGIRCTNVLRTLCDLGAVDPSGVQAAVGHAITTDMVTVGAIEMTILEHSEHGRAGVGPLRLALEAWTIDGKPADSVLELAMHRLIARYRLPPVEFHPKIAGFEVDFRVAGTAVVLECDGWTYHGADRRGFERDRERDATLIAAGWIPVRFTYRAITRHPLTVATRIRTALDRWSDLAPPDAA
jgi:very-short-patch-repair endonuclease